MYGFLEDRNRYEVRLGLGFDEMELNSKVEAVSVLGDIMGE